MSNERNKLGRRNFIQLMGIITGGTILAACNPKGSVLEGKVDSPLPTHTNTPVHEPTAKPTNTPEKVLSPLETWTKKHEEERLAKIELQGIAEIIPSFEYHGDYYRMDFPNGAVVELNPDGFISQMKWLNDHEFHAVNGSELVGFIKGKVDLPARSILLTFDLGDNPSSVGRVIEDFKIYNMHGIFTIYSKGMGPEKPVDRCLDGACWAEINRAYTSGYATIGSHTLTHRDFSLLSQEEGLKELEDSKKLIETMVGDGCKVNILTWPFESFPSWAKAIKDIGYEAAFGGNNRPIKHNGVHKNDELWYNLARVLPPNTDGFSGRPNGKTLSEIAKMYTTLAKDGMDLTSP